MYPMLWYFFKLKKKLELWMSDFKILVNFMKLSLHVNPVTALLKNRLKEYLKNLT